MVKEFFSGRRLVLIIILIIHIFIVGILFFLWAKGSSMYFLPEGNYLKTSVSPSGKYKVHVYVSSPSLSDDAVRCEVENIQSGNSRNIYWEYRKSDAEIIWINEKVVRINGKEINVLNEKYDYRKDKNFE